MGSVPADHLDTTRGWSPMPIFPPAASSPDENLPCLLDKVTKLNTTVATDISYMLI